MYLLVGDGLDTLDPGWAHAENTSGTHGILPADYVLVIDTEEQSPPQPILNPKAESEPQDMQTKPQSTEQTVQTKTQQQNESMEQNTQAKAESAETPMHITMQSPELDRDVQSVGLNLQANEPQNKSIGTLVQKEWSGGHVLVEEERILRSKEDVKQEMEKLSKSALVTLVSDYAEQQYILELANGVLAQNLQEAQEELQHTKSMFNSAVCELDDRDNQLLDMEEQMQGLQFQHAQLEVLQHEKDMQLLDMAAQMQGLQVQQVQSADGLEADLKVAKERETELLQEMLELKSKLREGASREADLEVELKRLTVTNRMLSGEKLEQVLFL